MGKYLNIFNFTDIEKHERSTLLILALKAMVIAVIIVASYSYQTAVFLNIFDTSVLPWLYGSVATVTVMFSFPYAALHTKIGEGKADVIALLFFSSGLLLGMVFPQFLLFKPTLFIFSIWVKLLGVFAAISFWHHATRAFPSRRAKVILPLLAAGFSLGSALAGKFVQLVALNFGSSAILPIIIIFALITIFLPQKQSEIVPVKRPRKNQGNLMKRGVTLLGTNKLAFYLTAFILFSIPVFIGTDFILKKSVKANFGQDQMAAFLGNYQLYMNLGVFLLQTLIMGKLMRLLGVKRITLVTPMLMIFAFPLLIIYPTLMFALVFAVFAGIMRLTVHVNSRNQLITPLSPPEKETASMFLRTIVAPIGTVLTSLALLPVKHSGIQVIAAVSLGMSVLFFLSALKVTASYQMELSKALRKKTLFLTQGDKLPPIPDSSVLQNLRDRVVSSNFEEASFAVSLLAEYDELKLPDLDTFFHKEFRGIEGMLPRLKAIELGLYLKPSDKERFFKTIFTNSEEKEILLEAARIISSPKWLLPFGRELFKEVQTQFKKGIALDILFNFNEYPSENEVLAIVSGLVSTDCQEDHLLAAKLSGAMESEDGDRFLKSLLNSDDDTVKLLCIKMIGSYKRSDLYDILTDYAISPVFRKSAFDAIKVAGLESVVAQKYIFDKKSPSIIPHIIKLLVNSDSPDTREILLKIYNLQRFWYNSIIFTELERADISFDILNINFKDFINTLIENYIIALSIAESTTNNLLKLELLSEVNFIERMLFTVIRRSFPKHRQRITDIEKSFNSKDSMAVNSAIELYDDLSLEGFEWFSSGLERNIPQLQNQSGAFFKSWNPEDLSLSELVETLDDPYLKEIITTVNSSHENERKRRIISTLHLRNSEFFRNLAMEIILEISNLGEELYLEEGETLFNQGDAGDGIYFIMKGEVEVVIQGKVVNSLSSGTVLGEIALLDEGRRTASIIASKNTEVVRISPQLFENMIHEYPLVAREVALTLVGHIRRLVPHVESNVTI